MSASTRARRPPASLRPAAVILALAGSMWSLAGGGCSKEKDSLVIVGLTSMVDLNGPTAVQITVGSVSHTFNLSDGLSATTAVRRGIYVGSKETGSLRVRASTQFGSPCVVYSDDSESVIVPAAGATVEVALTLTSAGSCGAGGTGGGAGGVLSLTNCVSYTHSAATDCTGANDAVVYTTAVSPNGSLVASAGSDGRVKIWRLVGNTLTAEGHVLTETGFAVDAFSPDGSILAVGWQSGIDLWNTTTWTRLRTLTTTGQVFDVGFTPDGLTVLSIDQTTLYAHAIAVTAAAHTVAIPEKAWAMATSPAASSTPAVAVATQMGTARVFTYNAATGFVAAGTPLPVTTSGDKTLSVRFSPDGKLIAAASDDGLVHFWNFPITSVTPAPPDIDVDTPALSSDINMLAFSADGRYLAVAGGFLGSLTTWNAAAPRANLGANLNPSSYVISVTFSPSGTAIIAGESDCGEILVCTD